MNNEPAFPTPRYERGDMYSLGMTLRDYFAAKAMHGLITQNDTLLWDEAGIADAAYRQADAMMKARGES